MIYNNLDSVLRELDEILKCDSYILFQGDKCEVTKITLDYIEHAFAYNGKIIFVHSSAEGYFDVTMSEYFNFNAQYKCLLLPDYCKNEFIHILKTK